MDDIWIISWFNHTAFDANPMWKSPICGADLRLLDEFSHHQIISKNMFFLQRNLTFWVQKALLEPDALTSHRTSQK